MYKLPGSGAALAAGGAGTLAITGSNDTGWVLLGMALIGAGLLSLLVSRSFRLRGNRKKT